MQRTISTINPVLGDASFVTAFGRPPTAGDDPALRVATHLGHVATRLRARAPLEPGEPRQATLAALDAYVAAGRFPASEADGGLLPSFVDPRNGARCAVAHLVEVSAGAALVEALDRDHHHDYIADFARDPRFVAWAATTGLSLEELAWIQPAYAYQPQPQQDLRIAVAAEVAAAPAPDDPAANQPHGFALVRAGVTRLPAHYEMFYNLPFVAVDGAVGATLGAHELAFDVRARVGAELHFWGDDAPASGNYAGYSIGVAIDRYGDALPAAWTVPIDGYWRTHVSASNLIGAHAGVHPAPGGFGLAERAWLGGVAGLEYTHRRVTDARDLTISLDATRLGDAMFYGVTVGLVTGPKLPDPGWE